MPNKIKEQKFVKKVEVYKETYRKGLYETDHDKIGKWGGDQDVWKEVLNQGENSDGTGFVTIKFNNLKR